MQLSWEDSFPYVIFKPFKEVALYSLAVDEGLYKQE